MNPLVSFVMPAWNPQPDWLENAVRHVLDQEGVDLELIVVDDGCAEPVAPLLDHVDDGRLRVVRVEHGGACAARNAGIAESQGSYLRFVDADDALERGSTARLLTLNAGADDVIAYGATLYCDQALRPVWTMRCRLQDDVRDDCLLGRFTVRPFSLLFPRAVVERTGAWDTRFRVSEDWDFILRALEHATVRGETAVATAYRKHASAATTDMEAGERGAELVLAKYFDRHPEQRGTRLERQVRARLDAMMARAQLTHGDAGGGWRSLRRSLRADPSAAAREVTQAAPALLGHARRRVSRLSRERPL